VTGTSGRGFGITPSFMFTVQFPIQVTVSPGISIVIESLGPDGKFHTPKLVFTTALNPLMVLVTPLRVTLTFFGVVNDVHEIIRLKSVFIGIEVDGS